MILINLKIYFYPEKWTQIQLVKKNPQKIPNQKINPNKNRNQKNPKISQVQRQPYFQYISEHTKEK